MKNKSKRLSNKQFHMLAVKAGFISKDSIHGDTNSTIEKVITFSVDQTIIYAETSAEYVTVSDMLKGSDNMSFMDLMGQGLGNQDILQSSVDQLIDLTPKDNKRILNKRAVEFLSIAKRVVSVCENCKKIVDFSIKTVLKRKLIRALAIAKFIEADNSVVMDIESLINKNTPEEIDIFTFISDYKKVFEKVDVIMASEKGVLIESGFEDIKQIMVDAGAVWVKGDYILPGDKLSTICVPAIVHYMKKIAVMLSASAIVYIDGLDGESEVMLDFLVIWNLYYRLIENISALEIASENTEDIKKVITVLMGLDIEIGRIVSDRYYHNIEHLGVTKEIMVSAEAVIKEGVVYSKADYLDILYGDDSLDPTSRLVELRILIKNRGR